MTRLFSLIFLFGICHLLPAQEYLADIQNRILEARNSSIKLEENRLLPVREALKTAYQADGSNLTAYWMNYARYQEVLFHRSMDQKEEALGKLREGIDQLESLKDTDSEIHALLGMMYSLAISFEPNMAVAYSTKADRNYNKARRLDPENLRAWLGLGRSDFYTPEEYGGGQEVEKCLTQALSLPEKSGESEFAPSWGKDEAYFYLAKYYEREGHIENAVLYCKQGLRKFPGHFRLGELMTELSDQ